VLKIDWIVGKEFPDITFKQDWIRHYCQLQSGFFGWGVWGRVNTSSLESDELYSPPQFLNFIEWLQNRIWCYFATV